MLSESSPVINRELRFWQLSYALLFKQHITEEEATKLREISTNIIRRDHITDEEEDYLNTLLFRYMI